VVLLVQAEMVAMDQPAPYLTSQLPVVVVVAISMPLVSTVAPVVVPEPPLQIMVAHLFAQVAESALQVVVLPLVQGQQPFPVVAGVLAVLV
jgi:hypothetical protein